MNKISIVVPVFNEQEVIARFHETVRQELHKIPSISYELVYVNDGSTDQTFDRLLKIYETEKDRVVLINFVRNFGQVSALLAGFRQATGDCAIVLSADLQDPPSMISKMLEAWQSGHKLVLSVRESRQDDLWSKITSKIFYGLMGRFANPLIPRGGFDYFLMDRALLSKILEMDERNCFLQGLVLWPGYKPKYLFYERQKRLLGKSHWTLNRKIKYFIDGFAAYSLFPIRFIALTGCILFAIGLLGAFWNFSSILFGHRSAENLSWLCVGLFSLGGLQMFSLGVIGEYVWRTLEQVRKRPLYLIDSIYNNLGKMS